MSVPYPYSPLLTPRIGDERTLVVDGIDTHWWEYAAKPKAETLVLVHGFRGDHHGLQLIADALPEFRIVIPDIPGFGSSGTWGDGEISIDRYGSWLRAFLNATSNDDSVVVGHSFGSIVVANGMRGTRQHPIVLINPISQRALKGPKRVAAAIASAWYQIGGALPSTLGRAWLSNPMFVRAMSEMLVKSSDSGLRRWIHDQHARYFSVYADRDSLIGAFTVSTTNTVADYVRDLTAPVLLVAADEDDITPIAAQVAIQQEFSDAELHIIAGVGHLVHYEKPIEAASAIRAFILRHKRA